MDVTIIFLSILLEPHSSSSAGPVVVVVNSAVLVHPGSGLVVRVFSDHFLGVVVVVGLKALLIIVQLGLGEVVVGFSDPIPVTLVLVVGVVVEGKFIILQLILGIGVL